MTKSHNWKSNDINHYNNNRRKFEIKRILPNDNFAMNQNSHVTKKRKIENSNLEANSEEIIPVVLPEFSTGESVELPAISVKEESTDVKCEPASGKF